MSSITCSLMQMSVCFCLVIFGLTTISWVFENKDRKSKDWSDSDV